MFSGPNRYSKIYLTSSLDRASRIPLKELTSSSCLDTHTASPQIPITKMGDHANDPGVGWNGQPPINIDAPEFFAPQVPPVGNDHRDLARELQDALAEVEILRAAAVELPLQCTLNPRITSVPTCMVLPVIPNGVHNIVPHGLFSNLPKFHGLLKENALNHIRAFTTICETQNEHTVGIDAYRMRLFPLTLAGRAHTWLTHLPARSINSWEELQVKFFEQFFPVHERQILETEIITFRQEKDEQIDMAWDRFNHLLSDLSGHPFTLNMLTSRFYNGCNPYTKKEIQHAHNFEFQKLSGSQAWDALKTLADHNRQIGFQSGTSIRDFPQTSHLAQAVENLTTKVDAMFAASQSPPVQNQTNLDCYDTQDSFDPSLIQEANYLGYQRKGDVPPSEWAQKQHRNIPGFRWSDPTGCANPEVLQSAPRPQFQNTRPPQFQNTQFPSQNYNQASYN